MDTVNLLKDPEKYAHSQPLNILTNFIHKCIESYENSNALIPDHIYDTIFDVLKQRDPTNKLITNIGHIVDSTTQDKVKLPYHMGSMTKIKDIEKIKNWLQKYRGPTYIVSEKLDGASAILQQIDGTTKLYSRGNGTYGRDISHLIKYMKLPKIEYDYCIRGELIVSKHNFSNYNDLYSNARSMINSVMGKKESISEQVSKVELVVFELLNLQKKSDWIIEAGLNKCDELGFSVCKFDKFDYSKISNFGKENKLEFSFLLKTLLEYRLNSKYDIDGIIITENKYHERNTSGNPQYSFAFKSNNVGQITKVKNVEWNTSKHGYLIPRICVEEINIDGVNIRYATGFNAKFIVDNLIGSNSEVRIVRSGDVIPFVIEIITKSISPIMPEVEYYWNDSMVNILVSDKENSVLYLKKLVTFFQVIGFENMSYGIIKKLFENDFDTIKKILLISKEDLIKIDGFKSTLTNKIYNNIHKIIDNPIKLTTLMSASLCFGHGFGHKKFEAILVKYPNILEIEYVTIEMLNQIDGFSDKTSEKFITNLSCFKDFLKSLDFLNIEKPKKKSKKFKIVGGLFENQKIVLTGFRDDKIIDYISKHNGTIINILNKNTNLLLVKDKDYSNSKTDAACLLGIPTLTKEEFIIKYNLI